MIKPQAPCKDCSKSGTLHERCQAYLDYKEDVRRFKDITSAERELDQYFKDSIYRRASEYNKKMHKKGR